MTLLPPTEGSPGTLAVAAMAVALDGAVIDQLVAALGSLIRLSPANSVPYREAEPVAWVERPRLVFVDFDRHQDRAVELGPKLMDMLPGVLLVAVSQRSEPDRIRTAMRGGYREYVVLPDDIEPLRRCVQGLALESEGDDENRGRVVAMAGSKGGAGVSTILVNLAAELATGQRVLAMDMVYGMGDLAVLLDLKPSGGMAELLRNFGRLDDRVLEACTTTHSSQVLVLPQPEDAQTYEPPPVDAVLRMLHVAARSFPVVLVDCGTGVEEQALTTIATADLVLLVTTPEVPALRNAWRRLRLFDRLGVERDRVRLVLNRWSRGSPVPRKDIEHNLGMPVFAALSDDPKLLYSAVNYGRLLGEAGKRATLTREVADLAHRLFAEGTPEDVAPKRSLFGWGGGRS
jgi:pilus assembly protein CpaE